jgi:outer membrane protein OmpA-like peptidoglycan-associated protein
MFSTTIKGIITIVSAEILFTTFLGSSVLAGSASDLKARALALVPAQSPISAQMSTRTLTLPLDEFALTTELRSIHFDFASAAIRPADGRALDANAHWMKANPDRPIALEGAADPRGSTDYNLSLAERRARAVRDYLVARGVAPERIAILSVGEARQACRDRNCWGLDRRVDFLVKKLPRQAP